MMSRKIDSAELIFRIRITIETCTSVFVILIYVPLLCVIETPGQGKRSCRGGERERTSRAREIFEAAPTRIRLPLGGQTGIPGGHVEMLPPAGSRLRVGAGGSPGEREEVSAILDGEAASTARTLHRDDSPGGEARQRSPSGAMSYRPEQVRGGPRDRQDHVRSGKSREEKILRRFRVNLLGRHLGQK